jgi:excisionase family DNA binding protein
VQPDAHVRISEWVAEHQGTRVCPECGGPVRVERRHYWRGLPTHHHGCWVRVLAHRRKRPGAEYYTGQQAADRLGIGRTTLGRWLRKKKIPPPVATAGAVLLFDRRAIDAAAGRHDR